MTFIQTDAGFWKHDPPAVGAGGAKLDANSDLATEAAKYSITITVDNNGVVIPTGDLGFRQVPFDSTIIGWNLLADVSGDVEFDIRGGALGSTSSIVAAAPPELISSQTASDSTLTGWTTSLTAGDVLEFEVVGTPASVTYVQLVLLLIRNLG